MLAIIDRNQPDPDDVADYLKNTAVSLPVGQLAIKIRTAKLIAQKNGSLDPKTSGLSLQPLLFSTFKKST